MTPVIIIGFSVFVGNIFLMYYARDRMLSNSIVNNLHKTTTFTIEENGNYSLWANYRKINNHSENGRTTYPGPYPLKETFYGIHPTIIHIETGEQVDLISVNNYPIENDDAFNKRYLICEEEDYSFYLKRGTYRFQKIYMSQNENKHLTSVFTSNLKAQRISEPVIYSIRKPVPRYLNTIESIGPIIFVVAFLAILFSFSYAK